jgi:hypothetical protein
VTIFRDGREVRSLPLVTADAVPKAGILRKLVRHPLGVIAVVALLALAGARLRRQAGRKTGVSAP